MILKNGFQRWNLVARRQTHRVGLAAFLLAHGANALYVMATVVIGIGVIRGETSVSRYFSLKKSQRILEETVDSLREENKNLANEIHQIKESRAYARKVLRDKYHVTDEGEKIVYYAD